MSCLVVTLLVAAVVMLRTGPAHAAELPAKVERVGDNFAMGVIHGWQTNHLLMYKGVLYANGRVEDPKAANPWQSAGAYYRREADGTWAKVGTTPLARIIHEPGVGVTDAGFWALSRAVIGLADRPTPGRRFRLSGTCCQWPIWRPSRRNDPFQTGLAAILCCICRVF